MIVASWAVGVIVAAITFVFGAAIESAFGLGALAGLVYAMYEYHHIVRTIERN